MIRIGLSSQEKTVEIDRYLAEHEIKKVFIFYPAKFPLPIDLQVPAEFIEYADIIMYKFFYRLLEEIDDKVLLIFNECLRTQNRSDLTYNCAHHYCNQTPHKIIFECFPFVEDKQDFMILLDFWNKGRYKGKSFDYQFIKDEDIKVKWINMGLVTIDLNLADNDVAKYEVKKEQLFNNLGNGDPDTIPRQLHIFAGGFKKSLIHPDLQYVARNDRFKLPNVTVYKDAGPGDYTVVDFPHRRVDFNDFLKKSGVTYVNFINSGLKVDLYYINEFEAWVERLNKFYAETSLY